MKTRRIELARRRLWCALASVSLFASAPAWAQGGTEGEQVEPEDQNDDGTESDSDSPARNITDALRDRPTGTSNIMRPKVKGELLAEDRIDRGDQNLRWRLGLNTLARSKDNLDFRANNDDAPQDSIDTDDRLTWGATQLRAGISYDLSKNLTLDVGIGHNGLWGGDAIGSIRGSNQIFIDTTFADWRVVDTDAARISLRFGRQYFSIGGTGGEKDFFFWDVVDGLTTRVDLKTAGVIRGMVDIVGVQLRPDESDFLSRQDTASSDVNFGGDSITTRAGLTYENDALVDGLELRAFGFYADVGASTNARSTGADLSYRGSLGNFSDSDFTAMFGGRAGYYFRNAEKTLKVGGFGEFASSTGLDRKDRSIGLVDVGTGGLAFGGGVVADVDFGSINLSLAGRFFRADGPQYLDNGMMFSHGFVSFKGAHTGGVLMDDVAGWHPSSYVASNLGVETSPQSQSRKAGTQTISARLGVGISEVLKLQVGYWNISDTGVTDVSNVDAQARDLPFGYSAADLEAQERLGSLLGQEIDLGLTFLAQKELSIFAQGGVFLPGDFYGKEITRSGGSALGSTNPQNAWVVLGGATFYYE